jgi:agmatinase
MWNKNVETLLGCGSEYGDASVALFGAPLDGTVSYRPGARFGPSAIRRESSGLETYSPYLDRDLSELAVFDGGDLELCFGNPARAVGEIAAKTGEILRDGKLPFLLGGEHLVTLGAFRAVWERFPDIRMLHFDAHADLREEYLGERLSHATVIRRCHDLTGDGRIFQFGIRSGDRSEFLWSREGHTEMRLFDMGGLAETIGALAGKPVYLTVDLDVLAPAVFPGTGTPEAGGVGFGELRQAVTAACTGCRIVGCDVVELSPPYDPGGISIAAAGKLVREMLLALNGEKGS